MSKRRKRARSVASGRHSGYSVVELAATVTVLLIVISIAIPNFLRAMNSYQLNGAAQNVSGLIQRARYEAIKRNTKILCYEQVVNNRVTVWVDLNNNGAPDANEPQYVYPQPVLNASPGGTIPGPASMGFPNAQQPPGFIAFDSRGAVDYTGVPGGPTVWAVYFSFQDDQSYGYKAITVEPFGRSKVWTAAANGSWHNP